MSVGANRLCILQWVEETKCVVCPCGKVGEMGTRNQKGNQVGCGDCQGIGGGVIGNTI